MLTRIVLFIGFISLVGFGVWQYDMQKSSAPSIDDSAMEHSAMEHAEKHLDPNYVCPMHPSVVSDKPGSCPICGMDLEQKKISSKQSSGVEVSAAMQRSLGVSTTKVGYGAVIEEVYASGFIEHTLPAKSSMIDSTVSGTVLKVLHKAGDWVSKNDPLIVIDVPEYTETLDTYLEAREEKRTRTVEMREALNKLWAMGADRIVLMQSAYKEMPPAPKNLNIAATQAGQVKTVNVEVGDKIEVGTALVHIQTPKLYEAELHSYSSDAIKVSKGNAINIKIPSYPGKIWKGRVLSQSKRKAGLDNTIMGLFELPEKLVFDRMFIGGFVEMNDHSPVLRIPTSAVIYGDKETRVIRKHEDGHFLVLEVELGRQTSDWVEVVSGLREGGSVVTRGQFMIDSEASLRAGLNRISEGQSHD